MAEATPEIWKRLTALRKIFLNMYSCMVAKFEAVSRCFKCQKFGHPMKFCRSETRSGHCAGAGHDSKECTRKTGDKKCANCPKGNWP